MHPIYLHEEVAKEKASTRVCSLIAATEKIGYYNIISIPEYEYNGTTKSQATKI